MKNKPVFAHLEFNIKNTDLVRFNKVYAGVVENVGLSYSIQEIFNNEGYFFVRVSPLGANLRGKGRRRN